MRRRIALVFALWLLPAPAAAAWSWPVDGPVLRPFSLGDDPYAGGQHRGVDIGASADEHVRAPVAGDVSFAGTVPRNGRSVTIRTLDGYSVTLVHLGALEVRRGDSVEEGDAVATVGPSGDAEWDRPYVHLGVRVTADPHGYVDPLLFLPARPEVASSGSGATGGSLAEADPPPAPVAVADATAPAVDPVEAPALPGEPSPAAPAVATEERRTVADPPAPLPDVVPEDVPAAAPVMPEPALVADAPRAVALPPPIASNQRPTAGDPPVTAPQPVPADVRVAVPVVREPAPAAGAPAAAVALVPAVVPDPPAIAPALPPAASAPAGDVAAGSSPAGATGSVDAPAGATASAAVALGPAAAPEEAPGAGPEFPVALAEGPEHGVDPAPDAGHDALALPDAVALERSLAGVGAARVAGTVFATQAPAVENASSATAARGDVNGTPGSPGGPMLGAPPDTGASPPPAAAALAAVGAGSRVAPLRPAGRSGAVGTRPSRVGVAASEVPPRGVPGHDLWVVLGVLLVAAGAAAAVACRADTAPQPALVAAGPPCQPPAACSARPRRRRGGCTASVVDDPLVALLRAPRTRPGPRRPAPSRRGRRVHASPRARRAVSLA